MTPGGWVSNDGKTAVIGQDRAQVTQVSQNPVAAPVSSESMARVEDLSKILEKSGMKVVILR